MILFKYKIVGLDKKHSETHSINFYVVYKYSD